MRKTSHSIIKGLFLYHLLLLDTPAVCLIGASQNPLPDHVSGGGDGTGACVDSQVNSAEICQSEVPPHAGYHQYSDLHIVFV